MARALNKKKHEKFIVGLTMNEVETAMCENCGNIVSRSQYGRDDECPECGEWIDWWDDEE